MQYWTHFSSTALSLTVALGWVGIPLTAQAFHPEEETLDLVRSGPTTFAAHAGDILSINAQSSGGNSTCTPSLDESSENLVWLGAVDRTPVNQSQVFQVEQDGIYQYTMPTPLDPVGSCSITLSPANRYEQLFVQAQQLRDDEATSEQAIELYLQAIELEPDYPYAYKDYLGLVLDSLVIYAPDFEPNPSNLGEIWLEVPEGVKVSIISGMETLAQIYETTPEWQADPMIDNPEFLRSYADFVRTGEVPAIVQEILFGE